jgi:hypothetical protein
VRTGFKLLAVFPVSLICGQLAVGGLDNTSGSPRPADPRAAPYRFENPRAKLALAEGPEADAREAAKLSAKDVEKRRSRYLKQHSTMSKDGYDLLFRGACDQRNTRDCFILAALGSIPLSHREALFRTSITRDEDGFVVRFPMGVSDPRDSVRVHNRDLGAQVVYIKGKRAAYQPVNTTAGWKALEAAYILLAFGRDQRGQVNREAAANGDPVTVLERIVNTNRSAKIIIAAGTNPLGADPRNVAPIADALDSFDPDRHMLILGSLNVPSKTYLIDGVTYTKTHAYVVPTVDQQKQTVMLINPHDSRRPLVVPYGTVVKAFRILRRLELDVESTYQ